MRTLMLICVCAAGVIAQQGGTTVVKAAKAHLGDGRVVSPAAVVIAKGKIAGIGGKVPAGARVIDLGDAVLTPGIVDALSYVGLPLGVGQNEQTTEITPDYRVSRTLTSDSEEYGWMRARGVTSVVVHPGARNVIGGLACHVKLGPDGPRVVKDDVALRITLGPDAAFGNRNVGMGNTSIYSRIPVSRMGTVYAVRDAFQKALNYRARRKADSKAPANAAWDTLLRAVDGKIPICWQARSEKDMRAAFNIIEEFSLPRNVIVEALEAHHAMDGITRHRVPVLLGRLMYPSLQRGIRRSEGRRHSMRGPALLTKSGITAAFAGGNAEPGETLIDSLVFAVRAGLPEKGAIGWVSSTPARIMGIDGRVGAIAVGKDADLAAWSGDPLTATSAVRWTMIDGRVVFGRQESPKQKEKTK